MVQTKWWHKEIERANSTSEQERIVCDLCPRQCRMKEGDRGFCFVRKIENHQLVLDTYGKSTGFCIDPIEKKPLNHFYPGTSVLSFGTAGCNLGCQFCQNWDISKSREVAKLSARAEPETIANAAKTLDCRSVAFTYNDPVIWAEYAIDTAIACREQGVKAVAVTAGYMMAEARRDFYAHMDAANVDLKAFTEEFYRKITYSHLEPILETLRYLKHETNVWFEITNLLIPGANDQIDELTRMCDWIVRDLGPDVPIHFSAFHPDFRMLDRPRTPHETLLQAKRIATRSGIRYAYVGNVHDVQNGSTYCYQCNSLLIERDWYQLGKYEMMGNLCRKCGAVQSGRFDDRPGTWGRKRQPVNLDSFQIARPLVAENQLSLPVVETPVQQIRTALTTIPIVHSSKGSKEDSTMTLPTLTKLTTLKSNELTSEQKQAIHKATQVVLASTVLQRQPTESLREILGDIADHNVFGFFTTLSRASQLRGCCGFLGRPTPLLEAIVDATQRTAKDDVRMAPISPRELPYLSVDVSILSAPIPIDGAPENREQAIEIGKHGLRVSQGNRRGLLLPTVPIEQKWDVRKFLEAVCRKADLPETSWLDSNTMLETFEGLVIEGKMDVGTMPASIASARAPGDIKSLTRLKQIASDNIIAFAQNRTPSYVALDAMDGTVNGIVLSLRQNHDNRVLASWIQTSLRPGMPLQASLFELCKSAAFTLVRARFAENTDVEVDLTVLFDPIHHGNLTIDDWDGDTLRTDYKGCDLQGYSPKERAIVSMIGNRVAVGFGAHHQVHDLLQDVAGLVRLRKNPQAIFSMGCVSTLADMIVSSSSPPNTSEDARQPGVARAFYPENATDRQSMIREFMSNVPPVTKKRALAIMTPHAGLRFSGQVAADVWSSVELPTTLLILGPKHTNLGSDWAVSPSMAWNLPNGQPFEANLDLAKAIALNVDGMQLDASAHASEHSIEVQLPILEGLTEGTNRPKISAIVFRGANLEEIEGTSDQLASVLKSQAEMPLLVISSDLNHFQPEAENRRRDELAIEAMLTGDPDHLLEVCRTNQISMCGLVPAAIVMKTLQKMELPFRIERVSYTNSAQKGGDAQRVVGYAGVVILPA